MVTGCQCMWPIGEDWSITKSVSPIPLALFVLERLFLLGASTKVKKYLFLYSTEKNHEGLVLIIVKQLDFSIIILALKKYELLLLKQWAILN